MSQDYINIACEFSPFPYEAAEEAEVLRLLEQEFLAMKYDWVGVNTPPKSTTPDGQAFMLKKHDDGFWHVVEMYRGRQEFMGAFTDLIFAAEFFFVIASGKNVPPRF